MLQAVREFDVFDQRMDGDFSVALTPRASAFQGGVLFFALGLFFV
jgi:hypothetical protein